MSKKLILLTKRKGDLYAELGVYELEKSKDDYYGTMDSKKESQLASTGIYINRTFENDKSANEISEKLIEKFKGKYLVDCVKLVYYANFKPKYLPKIQNFFKKTNCLDELF
jgi:hypothetical protein